jgi:hypothetical protein
MTDNTKTTNNNNNNNTNTNNNDDWKAGLNPGKKDTRVKTADVTATKGNDFEGN